jgi:hypothetical protein
MRRRVSQVLHFMGWSPTRRRKLVTQLAYPAGRYRDIARKVGPDHPLAEPTGKVGDTGASARAPGVLLPRRRLRTDGWTTNRQGDRTQAAGGGVLWVLRGVSA